MARIMALAHYAIFGTDLFRIAVTAFLRFPFPLYTNILSGNLNHFQIETAAIQMYITDHNFRLLRLVYCANLCFVMTQWKSGDTVQLKSGGPIMTVTSVRVSDGLTYCAWFVGDENKGAAFPADALQKAGAK